MHISLWLPAELISPQSSDFRISSGSGTLCIRIISLVKQPRQPVLAGRLNSAAEQIVLSGSVAV